jgi:hypothetical protein
MHAAEVGHKAFAGASANSLQMIDRISLNCTTVLSSRGKGGAVERVSGAPSF